MEALCQHATNTRKPACLRERHAELKTHPRDEASNLVPLAVYASPDALLVACSCALLELDLDRNARVAMAGGGRVRDASRGDGAELAGGREAD